MIRDLIKVANKLDYLGLTKEADAIDALIRTASGMGDSKEEREKAIKERERAILEELDRLDPKRKLPKSTLSHEERARIKYIENHIKMINDYIVGGGLRTDPHSSDEYGINPEFVHHYYDSAASTFDSGLTDYKGSHVKRLTDALIKDEKDEDKRRHKAIIEGSRPRYEHMVRTEENSPSWFKDKIPSGGLQLGGLNLNDEGEWNYEESDEDESISESDEDESISESGDDESNPILGVSPEQDRVNVMRAADMLRNMTEEQFQALKREHPEAMKRLFGPGTLDEVKRANARMINFLMRK